MSYYDEHQFSKLLGKTLTSVEGKVDGDQISFKTDDGQGYRLYHDQDCCESVYVQDICGDLNDLVGSPIIQAEESTNSEKHPEGFKPEYSDDSFTWTFYRIATAKGLVVIRWFGSSNGYYSEAVTFSKEEGK